MKIICFQLKRIGDLVLTTPALVALAQSYPQAEIHVAADSAFSSLFPCLPANQVHPLRGGNFSVWIDLLRERYDICLDFNSSDRSALATFLINSPLKITYSQYAWRPFRKSIYHVFVPAILSQRHTADFHVDLLAPLGIKSESTPSCIHVPEGIIQATDTLLEKLHITLPFVIVHPGTLRQEKYWLNERWMTVMRHLHEYHRLPVVLTGSSSYGEQQRLKGFFTCQKRFWYDLTGSLDLSQFAALISRSYLLCGVDSSPIHIADALSVPCVALFGPTNPDQWRPRNPNSKILTPCAAAYYSKKNIWSMAEISVDAVITSIDSLLSELASISRA